MPPHQRRVFLVTARCSRIGESFGMMNVISPLYEVVVSALAEPREQREFQVIVGVYEAWEEQETA